jgi:protocatechuate 3,4-dioxygenase, beta subunit
VELLTWTNHRHKLTVEIMRIRRRRKPRLSDVFNIPIDRRRFFKSMAVASAGFALPGYLAEALTLTPFQTQGPYYPGLDDLPLGKDNDLLYLNDALTRAVGTITHVIGRVLDSSGNPIRNALVELWHADHLGAYTYYGGTGRNRNADPNFAGFGQYLTGATGHFRFRTIKAGLYPFRARHFHWGVTVPGRTTRFTTQTYWAGEEGNDGVLNSITDVEQRNSVILNFTPVPGTTTGEMQTTWDFVSEFTPVEPTYPGGGNLVVAGLVVSGPIGGNPRYRITVPAYTGYSYEIYGNPTLADLSWAALPFSLTDTGAIDRNIYTAPSDGTLHLFVERKSERGFYTVSFRVPGANTGTR